MKKVVADDVSTADVLWVAAERIGKSGSGEEIQKICDYLVNKHWFQTAGDLRVARLATEEWQSLQVPSRLKIAVQQVLDEVQYPQTGGPYFKYTEYAKYYPSQGVAEDQSISSHYTEWPTTEAQPAVAQTEVISDLYYYNYPQEYPPTTDQGYANQQEQQQGYHYSAPLSIPDASYDYSTDRVANVTDVETDQYGETYQYAETNTANVPAYAGDSYRSEYYPQVSGSQDYYVVPHPLCSELQTSNHGEAHVAVTEEGPTYEEILTPMPPEWHCNSCTFLNPISQSYCEMCHDHISASPDMVGFQFRGTGATSTTPDDVSNCVACSPSEHEMTPASSNEVTTSNLTPSHLACARYPSPIAVSSLYSPSAPSFEAMVMEFEESAIDQNSTARMVMVVTPTATQMRASGQAMFHEDVESTRIQQSIPPPTPENYLALAFKRSAAPSCVKEDGTTKTDQARQEQIPASECLL